MRGPTTWIKLDRNIVQWRWWFNHDILAVFIWSLTRANVEDYDFEGMTIHRGEFITSYDHMAAACGITKKQARTITTKLKQSGEWALKKIPKGLAITVCNYNEYQGVGTQRARKGHSEGTQRAREGHQYKNNKNDKEWEETRARATRPKSYMEEMDEIIDRVWDEMEGKQ